MKQIIFGFFRLEDRSLHKKMYQKRVNEKLQHKRWRTLAVYWRMNSQHSSKNDGLIRPQYEEILLVRWIDGSRYKKKEIPEVS